jgi:predicted nucleic acid-binding protein
VASLIDTNILVYRFDARYPDKQRVARDLLRDGLINESLVLPHQAIVEFVAAVTRRKAGIEPMLSHADALLEAESLLAIFPIVYPDREVLVTALRGFSAYRLSWFDAHLWAYAEVHGLAEIVSEDFEHGRHYGQVRVVDPFLIASGQVRELPELYSA